MHQHAVVFVGLAFVAFGCGGTVANGADAGDATTQDGTVDAQNDAGFGAPDAPVDVTPIVLDGGGAFLCLDCVCDGLANYCEHFSGGKAHYPFGPIDAGFGDASTCDPDAGQPYCHATPSACLPNPSCECVLANSPAGCTCDLDPSNNGLVVTCVFP